MRWYRLPLLISMALLVLCLCVPCKSKGKKNDKKYFSELYVKEVLKPNIQETSYVVLTCYEKNICVNCYKVPMDSVYKRVCAMYARSAIYVVTDDSATIIRMQAYDDKNVRFVNDNSMQMQKYGILREVPQVMVFENNKLKALYTMPRK